MLRKLQTSARGVSLAVLVVYAGLLLLVLGHPCLAAEAPGGCSPTEAHLRWSQASEPGVATHAACALCSWQSESAGTLAAAPTGPALPLALAAPLAPAPSAPAPPALCGPAPRGPPVS